MNKTHIVGNLTRDPETRVTQRGDKVCSFTVAVNRRRKTQDGKDIADYFRVSAWNALGENCQKYLAKGRKVAVTGPVSASAYKDSTGEARASLELMAEDVEFLTPKSEAQPDQNTANAVADRLNQYATPAPKPPEGGYVDVTDEEDLPF